MKNRTTRAHSTRRTATRRNPLLYGMLDAEDQSVRKLAEAFDTDDVHSRRAMLKHAAKFAGTVSDDVAQELGKLRPRLSVKPGKSTQAVPTPRTTRRRPTPYVPAGLVAAFKLIQFEDTTAIAAAWNATKTHPHAARIIDLLHGAGQDDTGVAVQSELDQATTELYGQGMPSHEAPAHEQPHLVSIASFHVGYAVCWLLMTALNGREGAR